MELVAAALAVLLASAGRWRLPGWSVVLPGFVGTGLLGGILVLLPVELVMLATGALTTGGDDAAAAGPIAGWVYAVVYSGFAVLGLCLLTVVVLHVRERWLTRDGWDTPVGTWGRVRPGASRRAAVAAAVAVVVACGAEVTVAASTGWFGGHEVVAALAALVGAGVAWSLVRRRPAGRHGGPILLLGVAAAAVVAAWGCYFFVLQVVPNPLRGADPAPVALAVTEAARAVTGTALAVALVGLGPSRRRCLG